jgi:protein ERP2
MARSIITSVGSFFLLVSFLFASIAQADTRVSIAVPAFAQECIYHELQNEEDTLVINYQVLYGGAFELDFEITSPTGQSIVKQENEKYADFLLKTFGLGEYAFCFSNPHNQFKKVEFSIVLKDSIVEEDKLSGNKDTFIVENSIAEIDRNLGKVERILNYLRAREWRNKSTVESTESRAVYLSIAIIVLTVGVSLGQAALVQIMFSSRQKAFV